MNTHIFSMFTLQTLLLLAKIIHTFSTSPSNVSICANLTNLDQYAFQVPDIYWQSCGFTPASDMLNPNGTENIWWMGRIPRNGIHYVRIHFLFDLLTVTGIKNKTSLIYNWTKLDKAMNILRENNRYPIFEFMGNPSLYFTNLSNISQLYIWKDLVSQTAQRYINIYSTKIIYKWLFESWNEPPNPHSEEGFNWTESMWTQYYDACYQGLTEVDTNLLLGGPSGAHGDYFGSALNHIINGTNIFTNKSYPTSKNIAFISFHNKGNEDEITIINKDLKEEQTVLKSYNELKNIPLVNDEGDPKEGWNKSFVWRATTSYAAFIVQGINLHLQQMNTIYNKQDNRMAFGLISNDNCFMGNNSNPSFELRTLNTRFTDNDSFEFVAKSSLNVMSLLSLHGNKILNESMIEYNVLGNKKLNVESMIFYNESDLLYEVLAVVYGNNTEHNDDNTQQLITVNMSFVLDILSYNNPLIAVWNLDYKYGNSYVEWLKLDSPINPTMEQIIKMRMASYPKLSIYTDVSIKKNVIYGPVYELNAPGVIFIHLIFTKEQVWNHNPHKVENVKIYRKDNRYSFINKTQSAYYISWDSINTHILKTFIVYYSQNKDASSLQRISNEEFINDGYIWIVNNINSGFIWIQATDYYGLNSSISDPISLP
eukprot:298149_1